MLLRGDREREGEEMEVKDRGGAEGGRKGDGEGRGAREKCEA